MIYILEIAVKEPNKEPVWLRKQIDFPVATGTVMLCHQLDQCRIDLVYCTETETVAHIESVIEPTTEGYVDYLIRCGWEHKLLFRPVMPHQTVVSSAVPPAQIHQFLHMNTPTI